MQRQNPVPTVDIIIATGQGIVLIKRKNPPYGWAMPGGFIDYGESAEHAAVREAKEETGLVITGLKQFHTYSSPDRDPRKHTISIVYTAQAKGTPEPADDAIEVGIFAEDIVPEQLAFDHRQILDDYFTHKY